MSETSARQAPATGPEPPKPPKPPEAPEAGTQRPARHGRRRHLLIALGLVCCLLAVAAAVSSAYVVTRHSSADHQRPSGIPPSVSTSMAYMMALSPIPPKSAPGFTLTDQAGRTLALSSFHGKAVVLEFMDPHCTDICPIVSDEFIRAYHDLGPLASKVAFVTVNVNQYHNAVSDVQAFSREQQLTSIPGWHFFTGAVPALRAVWRDYAIAVQAPNPDADVVHTSAVYFIDPQGRERYLAEPMVDHTKSGKAYLPPAQLAAWGHGIALVARDLTG
jgi:cytochrome oxidase Cu insertion factor (SCO1/SenC/PrrC family)